MTESNVKPVTIHDKMNLSHAITLARLAGFEIQGPAKLRSHRSTGLPIDAQVIQYKGEAVTDLEVAVPVWSKGTCRPSDVEPWPADALKFQFRVNGERRKCAVLLEVNASTGEMRVRDVPPQTDWA